jgi:protein SCO1/2
VIAKLLVLLAMCASAYAQIPAPGILTEIGIDQKPGELIPGDLTFRDEAGKPVRLGDYFQARPVVLSLVYHECPMLCSMALNGLVKSLRALPFDVGSDFDVLTVSIDPAEGPPLAASKKQLYLKQYSREGAAAGWHFLTGGDPAIRTLTDRVGFRYKRDPYTNQWAHVSAIIVLTPEGRISQYLYGIEYSARDLRLSLVEASRNQIGSIVDRVLLYCYHYDPQTGKYGFAIMSALRISGCATVLALGVFIFRGLRRDVASSVGIPAGGCSQRESSAPK